MKCQKCGGEHASSRSTNGLGFYFCSDCYEKILRDPHSPWHEDLKPYEKGKKWEREESRRRVAEYHAEQERTARICSECGAKHWCNGSLCDSCQRKMFSSG